MKPSSSATIHLIFDLVPALVDCLEDDSLEVPMVGFQGVFEVCTELSSLQNSETSRFLIEVPLEELAQPCEKLIARLVGEVEIGSVPKEVLPVAQVQFEELPEEVVQADDRSGVWEAKRVLMVLCLQSR